MKGRGLLKVTGILMIIGGIVAIIMGVFSALGVGALIALSESLGAQPSVALLVVGAMLIAISGAFELFAGITGVRYCDKPEKAGSCFIQGIIVAAFAIMGSVVNLIGGGSVSILGLILSLLLPVLYIIGAVLNKQEAGATVQQRHMG